MRRGFERILRDERTAWIVLAISVTMTLMAWYLARTYQEHEARLRFQETVDLASLSIEQRMAAYQTILRAGSGLFDGSGEVNRQEWRSFVSALKIEQAYPGIQGLGYAAMVPAKQKEALESRLRAEGFPDFAINPVGERDTYSAIVFLEPFDWRNQRAFGYDMYSEPVRRAAMDHASRRGDIAMSGKVRLVQETDRDVQPGTLMYMPVYRETVHRKDLQGYVYGVFRIGDLMQGILGRGNDDVRFELYDGQDRLYDSLFDGEAAGTPRRSRYVVTVPIEIAGRTWGVHYSSRPRFEAQVTGFEPTLIGLGGLLADFLLFATLRAISMNGRLLVRRNEELAAGRSALAEERARFQLAVEAAPVAMIMVDGKGRFVMVNAAMERMFGYAREELIGREMEMLLPAEAHSAHAAARSSYLHAADARQMGAGRELYGIRKDGERVAVEIGLGPVTTDEGVFVLAVIADIGERRRQTEALLERERRYRAVVETATDGFWLVDRNGRLIEINDAYCRMSGYSRVELMAMRINDLEAQENREETARHIENIYANGYDRFETTHRRKDGSQWTAEITVSMIPQLGDLFVFVRDLTEYKVLEAARRQGEEQIRALAFLDPLTQLPNRRLLTDRLRQALALARRTRRHGALLFIDLDNFKQVNDCLGHEMGDQLLVEVAGRLREGVREEDTVARLGGDEFVVMLAGLSDSVEGSAALARQVGEKLLEALNRPYRLGRHEYRSTPSVGVTLFQEQDEDVDSIFRRADAAMYQVKASGRNGLRFFDEVLSARAQDKRWLAECLASPSRENRLEMLYQPVFDEQGAVAGVEALMRWHHPERGLLVPAEFMSLADGSGQTVNLGTRALELACADLALWKTIPAMAGLDVAVNIHAQHFRQPAFVDSVRDILAETGADPGRLILELNESWLARDEPGRMSAMSALKALGVRFSMDDFGACYLSMGALLRGLPFDSLKLDHGCLVDLSDTASGAGLARSIIALGNSLAPAVSAKGVETASQWKFLIESGCRRGQGFLLSQPMPADRLIKLCEEQSRPASQV